MRKQISSSIMPITFYAAGIMNLILIGILLFQWLDNRDATMDIPLLFLVLFLLYLVFLFSLFRKVETDSTFYYFTHMLTFRTEQVPKERIVGIRPSPFGFLDPLTKVLVYLDEEGRERKLFYIEKFGLI